MMGRALCLHKAWYSMDVAANLQMLSKEFNEEEKADGKRFSRHCSQREALWRLWIWIKQVEYLSSNQYQESSLPSHGSGKTPYTKLR